MSTKGYLISNEAGDKFLRASWDFSTRLVYFSWVQSKEAARKFDSVPEAIEMEDGEANGFLNGYGSAPAELTYIVDYETLERLPV